MAHITVVVRLLGVISVALLRTLFFAAVPLSLLIAGTAVAPGRRIFGISRHTLGAAWEINAL
jgi:hypothetical protein